MSALQDDESLLRQLRQAAGGDQACWQAVLGEHRDRLRRLVAFRMDRRLQGRVDPSDILQESYLDAARRLPDYLDNPPMPFFLWLRFLTQQRLVTAHRHHLGRSMRDAGREVSLTGGGEKKVADVGDSSAAMAVHLLGRHGTPSEDAIRTETAERLRAALEAMPPMDREVLALRHFEGLNNAETAELLGLQPSAASKRYIRAVERLRVILEGVFGPAAES